MTQDGLRTDRRVPSLDVVRGIAIAMVLVAHMPIPQSWTGIAVVSDWLTLGRLQGLGAYGVDLFFVLSGLLISSLLLDEFDRHQAINIPRFWIRRSFKIWPAYFIIYGAAFVAKLAWLHLTGRGPLAAEIAGCSWPNFLFIQNYVHPECFWHFSWSIAVEEHFYLVLPFVVIACMSRGRSSLIVACALAFTIVVAMRVAQSDQAYHSGAVWRQTHLRADGLIIGVLLGVFVRRAGMPAFFKSRHAPAGIVTLMLAIFAMGYAIPPTAPQRFGAWMTLVALGSGVIVFHAAKVKREWVSTHWSSRSLVWLGRYSYTIYLCQILVFEPGKKINAVLGNTPVAEIPLAAAFFVGGSILAGWGAHKLVERPFLKIRDHYFPSLSSSSNSGTVETAITAAPLK